MCAMFARRIFAFPDLAMLPILYSERWTPSMIVQSKLGHTSKPSFFFGLLFVKSQIK